MDKLVYKLTFHCLLCVQNTWIYILLTWSLLTIKSAEGVRASIGNPIVSSQSTVDAIGNAFVFDGITMPQDAILYSVTGNYKTAHQNTFHIWRPGKTNQNFTLIHQMDIIPIKGSGTEEILFHQMTNAVCYEVKKGDVLGLFIKTSPTSLTYATNSHTGNPLRKSYNSPSTYPAIGQNVRFDGLVFPFQFSIKVTVDIGESSISSTSGYIAPNCTLFNRTAQDYQAWLDSQTTTSTTPPNLKGEPGSTGARGPQGSPGATGLQGPMGYNGTNGLIGMKGDPGIQGIQGIQGASGLQGPKGQSGVSLSKGDKGDAGLKGNPGLKGDLGSTGPAGLKGGNGSQGIAGLPGTKGDIGSAGVKGLQGLQGIKGIKGANGSPGGATGNTGARGLSGLKGNPGIVGPIGPPGPPTNISVQPPQSAASVGNQQNSAVLKDSIIIFLLIWQAITTLIIIALCICYMCRRNSRGRPNQIANFNFDSKAISEPPKIVKSVGGKYEGTVVRKGSMLETNVNWTYTKTAPIVDGN